MDFSLLNIVLCAAVPISWVGVGLYCRRWERRCRQREERWEQFSSNRVQLNRELERIWDLLKR